MAAGIPSAAGALLTRAQARRQEAQLADPNSALNQQMALENRKLALEAAKLGMDLEQARAKMIQTSVDLGINLTGMDENTFMKAMMWSVRGEPMISNEDRQALEFAQSSMQTMIQNDPEGFTENAEFKKYLEIFNGIMNRSTGTEGIEFVTNENYNFWDEYLLGQDLPFRVQTQGTQGTEPVAAPTLSEEEQAAVDAGLNQLNF
jgi:hypothetical protein